MDCLGVFDRGHGYRGCGGDVAVTTVGCMDPNTRPWYHTIGGDVLLNVTEWCPGPGCAWTLVYPKPYRFSWEPDPWWEAHDRGL